MLKKYFSLIIITTVFYTSPFMAADSEQMFRQDSILSDKECDEALNYSSNIYMYIGFIKQAYNSICNLDKVKCSDNSEITKNITSSLKTLETNALRFELEAIKKECI